MTNKSDPALRINVKINETEALSIHTVMTAEWKNLRNRKKKQKRIQSKRRWYKEKQFSKIWLAEEQLGEVHRRDLAL